MNKVPQVAIVGRMNVGKSTLFNRLSKNTKSLALDYAGVTRDVIKDSVDWLGREFELIDTGGISFKKSNDPLLEKVRLKALQALENSQIVLFVVDGVAGVTAEDEEIAHALRRYSSHVILVINKEDVRSAEENRFEFYRLMHNEVCFVSAQHGRGIGELLDAIVRVLPPIEEELVEVEPRYKVTFLGRPNVGKSSLMNALLKSERSIVSDIPGTTREAVSERISFSHEHLQITDTPGVRRSRSVEEDLEALMVKSSFKAVKDSNIVVLMIDATQAGFVDQELKLAFYAFADLYKALIVVVNKIDLVGEEERASINASFARYSHLMDKVEVLYISCKTGKNIDRVLPLIKTVWERHSQRLPENALNLTLIEALQKVPLVKNKQRLEIRSVRQLAISPITLLLLVNQAQFFGSSQRSFLENVLRKQYDLKSVPIKFVIA